jgi:hypothetical protein
MGHGWRATAAIRICASDVVTIHNRRCAFVNNGCSADIGNPVCRPVRIYVPSARPESICGPQLSQAATFTSVKFEG